MCKRVACRFANTYKHPELGLAVASQQPCVHVEVELDPSHVMFILLLMFAIPCYEIHYALYACIPHYGRDVQEPGGQVLQVCNLTSSFHG